MSSDVGFADFYIKQNDLLPVITATLKDGDKNPVDLSTATSVKFLMRKVGASAAKVNAAAAITDAVGGDVTYSWVGTDTDTTGDYQAEWEVNWGTKTETFPNDGWLRVKILDDIG